MTPTDIDRTLALNCPRCGATLNFEIWRADVRVRAHDVSALSGQRSLMAGLSADVELVAKHSC